MMTVGGATKLVSDISSLADLARLIGDSGKADKLDGIKKEFQASLEELKALDKKVSDKQKVLSDDSAVNQMTHNALQKWEDELKGREKDVIWKEQDLSARISVQDTSEKEFDDNVKALEADKKDFTATKERMLTSIDNVRKENEDTLDKKTRELKRREDAVSLRENNVSVKETSLFKQSQLAAEFVKSVR